MHARMIELLAFEWLSRFLPSPLNASSYQAEMELITEEGVQNRYQPYRTLDYCCRPWSYTFIVSTLIIDQQIRIRIEL